MRTALSGEGAGEGRRAQSFNELSWKSQKGSDVDRPSSSWDFVVELREVRDPGGDTHGSHLPR